jgi:hypothetical protein
MALLRPVDAEEPTRQIVVDSYRLVDALGLGWEIGIEGAYDDARVDRRLLMQPNEVLSVQGQDRTHFCRCEEQDLGIGHSIPGITRFLNRQDIVPSLA